MAQNVMPFETDHGVDIVITAEGSLTINGKPVVLENGSVEGDCIVGALRGEGVYIPRISIPLEMCRMGLAGDPLASATVDDKRPPAD